MRQCKKILLHLSMICSSIDVMTMVLDYYNPYMNFSGAVRWLHLLLFGCLFLLLLLPQKRSVKTDCRRYVPDRPQARRSGIARQQLQRPISRQAHA